MPIFRLKKVWDYCSYNIPFFIFVLILIYISMRIPDFSSNVYDSNVGTAVNWIISILLMGYGMSITRDRINHGYRLPKIEIGDAIFLGIKALIVFTFYLTIQGAILGFVAYLFDAPVFDLEELFLNLNDYMHLLYAYPDLSISFVLLEGFIFYVTTFFGEIGIARVADTKKLLSAFNLVAIIRSINIFGWRNYAKDLTSIVIALVILTYLQSFLFPIPMLDNLWETFLGFLIFATQFLGIGAIYCKIKDKEKEMEKSQNDFD